MRKALQALPPACSTAMGLERRAVRSYRDGGGFSMPPSAPSIRRMHPRRPPAPLHPPTPPPTSPSFCRKVSFSAASSLPWQPCCSLPSGCNARRGGAELQTPTAVLWVLGSIAHVQPRPCSPVTQPQPHAAPPYPHLQRAELWDPCSNGAMLWSRQCVAGGGMGGCWHFAAGLCVDANPPSCMGCGVQHSQQETFALILS